MELARKTGIRDLSEVPGGERECISGQMKFEVAETCQLALFLKSNFSEFGFYPKVCGNLPKDIKHENNIVNMQFWRDHCGCKVENHLGCDGDYGFRERKTGGHFRRSSDRTCCPRLAWNTLYSEVQAANSLPSHIKPVKCDFPGKFLMNLSYDKKGCNLRMPWKHRFLKLQFSPLCFELQLLSTG